MKTIDRDYSAKELNELAGQPQTSHRWADCLGYDCAQPACPISKGTGRGSLFDSDHLREARNEAEASIYEQEHGHIF